MAPWKNPPSIARAAPPCDSLSPPSRPAPPRRTELGDLLEEIGVASEKEREPRREVIHVQADRLRPAYVLEAVREREAELLNGRRPRLPHVIARDRNGIEAHLLVGDEAKYIGDEAQ